MHNVLIAYAVLCIIVTIGAGIYAAVVELTTPVDEMTAMYRWMDGEKLTRREARAIGSGSRQRR